MKEVSSSLLVTVGLTMFYVVLLAVLRTIVLRHVAGLSAQGQVNLWCFVK